MLHQRDLPAFPQDDPAVALVVADLALDADLFAVPRLDAGKTGPGVLHHDRRENLVGIRGPEIQKDRAGIRDGDLADRVFDHHFLSRLRRCGFRVKHVPAERLREQPGNHEDEDQLSHVPRVVDCGARHKDLFLGLRERIVFGGAGGMICEMDRVLKELRECPRIVWEAVLTFNEIDGEQRAASFAYYALFSLVPLFALMLTAGSSMFDSQEVIHTVERYFPIGAPEQAFMWQMVASLERSRGSVTIVHRADALGHGAPSRSRHTECKEPFHCLGGCRAARMRILPSHPSAATLFHGRPAAVRAPPADEPRLARRRRRLDGFSSLDA